MDKKLSYPAIVPKPGEGEWQDITLYAITGWFSQVSSDGQEGACGFGGFIKVAEDGSFAGMLVDSFGAAEITGNMNEELLSFSKHYFAPGHNSTPIAYGFQKSGDEWKGGYCVPGFVSVLQKATCKVFRAIDNAYGIAQGDALS